MNDLVKRVKSFVTFDYPLQSAVITAQFADTHRQLQIETPGWSTTSTRQKLIADYWFRNVTLHFATMFVIPALITTLIQINSGVFYMCLMGTFTAGIVTYYILYLFHYRPYYSAVFLPRLETIKETYEKKELEQLEKCRRNQLSNFALTLIFYVFDKTGSMGSLQCNDNCAKLMAKLYGVDQGSLKKNLALILGKNKSFSVRKYTEIRNQFEEAFTYLEEANCKKGIEVLKSLESRILS